MTKSFKNILDHINDPQYDFKKIHYYIRNLDFEKLQKEYLKTIRKTKK